MRLLSDTAAETRPNLGLAAAAANTAARVSEPQRMGGAVHSAVRDRDLKWRRSESECLTVSGWF